eukprot:c24012_g1_i1 orf=357-1202(+)
MEKENNVVDIQGKIVLVTGASAGLGREFCLKLAREGAHVVAAARRTELLQSLLGEIEAFSLAADDGQLPKPGKAAIVQMDVSKNEEEIDAAVDKAWRAFGKIDVLINNAGYRGPVASLLDWKEEEWDKVISTNLRGAWLVSKAVGKRMVMAKIGGSIVNISSIGGLDRGVLPGASAYQVSKAALNQLTKIMALELGKHNIRVNSIAAGLFRSEITGNLLNQEWMLKVAKKIVPVQRWGDVDPDLTALILVLASDSSVYITGCIFVVDGGQAIAGLPIWSSL